MMIVVAVVLLVMFIGVLIWMVIDGEEAAALNRLKADAENRGGMTSMEFSDIAAYEMMEERGMPITDPRWHLFRLREDEGRGIDISYRLRKAGYLD